MPLLAQSAGPGAHQVHIGEALSHSRHLRRHHDGVGAAYARFSLHLGDLCGVDGRDRRERTRRAALYHPGVRSNSSHRRFDLSPKSRGHPCQQERHGEKKACPDDSDQELPGPVPEVVDRD